MLYLLQISFAVCSTVCLVNQLRTDVEEEANVWFYLVLFFFCLQMATYLQILKWS